MEFVQSIGAQPAAERIVEPRRAQRHEPHGLRRRGLADRQRRIESHVFMICSFGGYVSSVQSSCTGRI
jgi:hypothetical protein